MNKQIDAPSSEGISPLGIFLSELHDDIVRAEITGKVADYIPELAKADLGLLRPKCACRNHIYSVRVLQ